MFEFHTQNKELVQGVYGPLGIVVSGSKHYSDSVWQEYLASCKAMFSARGIPRVILNYSPILGPSATQRSRFAKALPEVEQMLRVVLISESTLVRGSITAMRWLTGGKPDMRALSAEKVDEGLDWLNAAAPFNLQEARSMLLELVAFQGDDPIGLCRRH